MMGNMKTLYEKLRLTAWKICLYAGNAEQEHRKGGKVPGFIHETPDRLLNRRIHDS